MDGLDDAHAEIDGPAPGVNDFPGDMGAVPHIGASMALHLALLLVSALIVPCLPTPDDSTTDDTQYLISTYLGTPGSQPDEPDEQARTPADRDPDGLEPSQSRCGEVRGGTMGEPTARDVGTRYGVEGPQDNPDPHISHFGAQSNAAYDFPGIGITPELFPGDPRAPTAVWGRDDSLGTDSVSARAHMWGVEIRESFGSPGTGIGRKVLCPTCGSSGTGAERQLATAEGGPTGTAPYHWLP